MIDWSEYIASHRGLLIAPAGHGKTTAIADCILQCPKNSCHLILTHTHAGIASLRTKLRQKGVPSEKYQLETITGFSQRYVLSYVGASTLPEEDAKNYFEEVITHCSCLFKSKAVQLVIKASYDGIFVDEYQDCTIDQHQLILTLADGLPLHLLGDPLQGIFNFETKPLVNFHEDLCAFQQFDLLDYPWRWDKTNKALGQQILALRNALVAKQTIQLISNPTANFVVERIPTIASYADSQKWLSRTFRKYESSNQLIIYPSYTEQNQYGQSQLKGSIADRIKLKSAIDFSNSYRIVDAIDSSVYYKCAKQIDTYLANCIAGKRIKRIARLYDLLDGLYINSTSLNKWIKKGENRFIERTKENAVSSAQLSSLYNEFENSINLNNLIRLIDFIFTLKDVKCHYKGVYHELKKSAEIVQNESVSLFEAMKTRKSMIRHMGRKIEGKCIGTTLLTKGLEFDTVIIYDAHKFEDSKNFYVAISRACRQLVLITGETTLNFQK